MRVYLVTLSAASFLRSSQDAADTSADVKGTSPVTDEHKANMEGWLLNPRCKALLKKITDVTLKMESSETPASTADVTNTTSATLDDTNSSVVTNTSESNATETVTDTAVTTPAVVEDSVERRLDAGAAEKKPVQLLAVCGIKHVKAKLNLGPKDDLPDQKTYAKFLTRFAEEAIKRAVEKMRAAEVATTATPEVEPTEAIAEEEVVAVGPLPEAPVVVEALPEAPVVVEAQEGDPLMPVEEVSVVEPLADTPVVEDVPAAEEDVSRGIPRVL